MTKKRKCGEGIGCKYINEFQHQLEFYHEDNANTNVKKKKKKNVNHNTNIVKSTMKGRKLGGEKKLLSKEERRELILRKTKERLKI